MSRIACITDPVFDRDIRVDMDRIPRPRIGAMSYRDFEVLTGPVHHFYLAAVFVGGVCEEVVGPAYNAETAWSLAMRRIDQILSEASTRPIRQHKVGSAS